MRCPLILSIAAPLALLLPTRAAGTGAIVPTQYATIQAAIDSGVDTVYVRDGTYDEDVSVTQGLALVAYPPEDLYRAHFARVTSLSIQGQVGDNFSIRGIGVRGLANAQGNGTFLFEACRFESGLTCGGQYLYVNVEGCQFLGPMTGYVYNGDVTACSFWRAHLSLQYEGLLRVRYNIVEGPVTTGLEIWDGDSGVEIEGNTVVGATTGIAVYIPLGGYIRDNRVLDCAGDGLLCDVLTSGGGSAEITGNEIRRCGANGIHLIGGAFQLAANTIDSVAQCGIRAQYPHNGQYAYANSNLVSHTGSHGIWVDSEAGVVRGNRVLFAAGDGVRVLAADSIYLNVVGRCGGAGVTCAAPDSRDLILTRNTSYANGAAGFVLTTRGAERVDANIGHANLGAGLAWNGVAPPVPGCNDWFGNLAGTVTPGPAGATDVSVNPLFCNLPGDDVTLSSGSPLVALSGSCGPIGALDVGCATALDVPDPPAAAVLTASPQPAREGVRFGFPRVIGAARLEVYDVAGARRWSAPLSAGAEALFWDGAGSDGSPLPAGVYFARLIESGVALEARVVLVR